MANMAKELEKQLTEAGKMLLDPPSSVEELLPLLDKAERCLSEVEQSPPDSMQNALSPLMKALVADRLFKHSDIDVNVAVAACISEITRITAPDAPYDDEQMKEVFQLIISSFENLTDMSSHSYSKRTSILETVAKVRSCVVMLDLECDALVIEMFQHFLKTIRDNHPDNVFSSMETIMTLVLEESEEISPELLSPILEYVRKDNKVPQISRKLAEQVLKNSATKLKPYLTDAIKLLGLPLDKCSDVVASICKGTSDELKLNESVANEKHDSQDNLTREVEDEVKLKVPTVVEPELADAPKDGSLKSEVSNGVVQVAENDSSADADSTNKQDDANVKNELDKPDKLGDRGIDHAGDEETGVENQQDQQNKKNGKQSSSVKQEESSKASDVEEETESRAPLDNKDGKSVPSSPLHNSSANPAVSSNNEKATSAQALQSKPLADKTTIVAGETTNVASPSQSECLPNDSRSKKPVNQKKKESSTKEAKSSADSSAKVAPEEPSSSEVNSTKRSGKKVASLSKTKTSVPTKKGTSKAKPTKQSGKKTVDSDNVQVPSKPEEDKKKQGHGKATDEKEQSHTSSDDDKKPSSKSSKDEEQPLEETPKTNAKGKRNLGKEEASEDKEFGENLVGARVKVWWPKDRAYYQGVVNSYDASKKKHLVLYDDGDQEILNLRREKWDFIKDESETAVDEKGDREGHDESSAMPQKKKSKTGNGHSTMQKKKGAASNKSKTVASASKSGKKSEDVGKKENRSVCGSKTSRSGKKSEDERTKEAEYDDDDDSSDEVSEEDKEKLKTVGKSAKAAKPGKAKEDAEIGSSKASSKKKEESSKSKPEPAKPVKGKTGKSNGKPKSASAPAASASKAKESESDSEDNPKAPETSSPKRKLPVSAKSGKQGKSGKKRKR